MCAAPGGKTTFIAQLMNDRGVIVANDRGRNRLTALMANLKRLGVTCATVISGRGERLPVEGRGFDRVLVDAPCSGEGKWTLSEEHGIQHRRGSGRTDLQAVQKALIKRGFDMLAPGGILVYSTCTYNPLENEAVVRHLLESRSDAAVDNWNAPLRSTDGVLRFLQHEYHMSCMRCKRFYPHHTGSGGFFVARIVKQ
jgi:16S rRNA C967 or C1407 C5-methylase (RsmB/RsmF family)